MKIVSILFAIAVGVTFAIKHFEEPVGSVSNSFCGSPDKHCTTFTYEVN
uniref:Uncharacterized protein n=1 Tax=Pseudomonas phage RVTF4 TaxID=3236931 RepID=A0AB39CCX9_9VIRU